MPAFYEFFAGGGLARAGLSERWQCLFANDIDPKKGASYAANWGPEQLSIADVSHLTAARLPGHADLAWASFPCQDLSLAGEYAGLKGDRSGTFWPFWRLMKALGQEGRAPRIVVLENVCGALTSHGGKDFATIANAIVSSGYRFGAIVMDAARFLPQSRPRLFMVAMREEDAASVELVSASVNPQWHPASLVNAHRRLSPRSRRASVWWNLPSPPPRLSRLADIIENHPTDVPWNTAAETRRLIAMMSPIHREKVEHAKAAGKPVVGAVYKRTRVDESGQRVQRAEVRFDGLAGCLRTPGGGSSRQTILLVEGSSIRSRLLSAREAARLMGLPDSYLLPDNYNDAYHLAGDGVAVPVVRFLAEHLLEPLLAGSRHGREEAA